MYILLLLISTNHNILGEKSLEAGAMVLGMLCLFICILNIQILK